MFSNQVLLQHELHIMNSINSTFCLWMVMISFFFRSSCSLRSFRRCSCDLRNPSLAMWILLCDSSSSLHLLFFRYFLYSFSEIVFISLLLNLSFSHWTRSCSRLEFLFCSSLRLKYQQIPNTPHDFGFFLPNCQNFKQSQILFGYLQCTYVNIAPKSTAALKTSAGFNTTSCSSREIRSHLENTVLRWLLRAGDTDDSGLLFGHGVDCIDGS